MRYNFFYVVIIASLVAAVSYGAGIGSLSMFQAAIASSQGDYLVTILLASLSLLSIEACYKQLEKVTETHVFPLWVGLLILLSLTAFSTLLMIAIRLSPAVAILSAFLVPLFANYLAEELLRQPESKEAETVQSEGDFVV